MTLAEFNNLNEDEQTAFAMQGNFIDVRFEKGLKVALYSHPDFYTEVFYDGIHNQVVQCRAFTSTAPLVAYINLIQP